MTPVAASIVRLPGGRPLIEYVNGLPSGSLLPTVAPVMVSPSMLSRSGLDTVGRRFTSVTFHVKVTAEVCLTLPSVTSRVTT